MASQRAENENWKKPNIQKTNLFGKKLQFVIDSSGIKRQILFYILFGKYSYTTFQFPVYIPYKQLDQGLKRQGHKNVDPILAKKTLPGQNRKKWYRKISRRYSRKIHGDTTMTPRIQGWNSLIGFPSEWLVFCPKMSDSLICSFLVSDLSDLLTIAHFL